MGFGVLFWFRLGLTGFVVFFGKKARANICIILHHIPCIHCIISRAGKKTDKLSRRKKERTN